MNHQQTEDQISAGVKDAKAKLTICKQCEKFNNTIKVCKICKCFMPAKTRLPGQHCPIGKW